MAREAQGDNGITKYQSYIYRTILYNTGTHMLEGLRNGDAELLANWLSNDDLDRGGFQKGLWLSGNGIAQMLDRSARPSSLKLVRTYAGVTVGDTYLEQSGDSSFCVRLDAAPGRDFGTAGSYASIAGNGCPSVIPFNVLDAIAANGGQGNLSYVNQDDGGTVTDFASVSNDKLTAGEGNWGVVLDAFSLHFLRATPSDWNGTLCESDTSAIGASMLTRTNDVFAWMGVPFGSALLKDPVTITVGVDETVPAAGLPTALFQNMPNPFNPRTTVRYQLGAKVHVTLAVYDVTGRLVRSLVEDTQAPGRYAVDWDGRTDAGEVVSSGVYWARLETAEGFRAATKMVVLQ
jgi:hypothetical protein